MSSNKHTNEIPDTVITSVMGKLVDIQKELAPYAITISAEERKTLPRMGDKTEKFARRALEYATNNSDLCASLIDMDDFKVDLHDATNLVGMLNAAQQVVQTIDDIEVVAGSEAYEHALEFYNYIKFLASQGVPNAKTIYEDLKQRFPTRRRTLATK